MRVLYITTVSSTMNAFFKPHIEMLVKEGHIVDLVCNDTGWPIDSFYAELGCEFYHVDFSRSPLSLDNVKAYGQLKKIIKNGNYDIVHCHTPNASVITRLVCRKLRKKGLKVFYTAHGFHFYKGAPMLNWMVFYPVEKFCSRFTDKLITINKEDFELAKTKFHAKEVHYIPGVGVDLLRFENVRVDRNGKRREIGVPEDAIVLLSVGELSKRKNHEIIIRALTKLGNPKIHYVIAGVGDKKDFLTDLSKELGIVEQLHLLGFRKDVVELYKVSDVFCFPSFQEGLPVALMEAMASGLPIVCSSIRGNVDMIDEKGGALFNPKDVDECEEALKKVIFSETKNMREYNSEKVKIFESSSIVKILKSFYLD